MNLLFLPLIFFGVAVLTCQPSHAICNYSYVAMNSRALGNVAQMGINQMLKDPSVQKSIADSVAQTPFEQSMPLHKILFNMDVSIKNFAREVIQTHVSAKNIRLKKMDLGEVRVNCVDLKCKMHVPIKSLSIQGDFAIDCLDDSCKGKRLIGLSKVNFEIASRKLDDAYIEYDVVIKPGASAGELLSLDPKSGKFAIAPEAQSLRLALSAEEEARARALYEESYASRKREYDRQKSCSCTPAVSSESTSAALDRLSNDTQELRIRATADSLKPFVENFESYAYYKIAQAALRYDEVRELQTYLARTLGPIVAETANQTLREMPAEHLNPEISFEAMSPSELMQQPDLNKRKTPRQSMYVRVTSTSREADGKIALQLQACDEASAGASALGRGSVVSIPPSQGSDLMASISIESINQYLKKSFSDPKNDNVYFENLADTTPSKKVGLNAKVRIHFNEPPQLVTKINPETKKNELFVTVNATESLYRLSAFKNFTMPLLSTSAKMQVGIHYDEAQKTVGVRFDNTRLSVNEKSPLMFVSDVVSLVTPIYLVKMAAIGRIILPNLNSAEDLKTAGVGDLVLDDFSVSEDGKYIRSFMSLKK